MHHNYISLIFDSSMWVCLRAGCNTPLFDNLYVVENHLFLIDWYSVLMSVTSY
jgi:hypothetical protein